MADRRSQRRILRQAVLWASGALLRAREQRGGRPARPARPRVLLIRPDHLGDLLLTSPTVGVLRKALPDAHLAMIVGPWSEEIARRDALLDEVVVCPFPGFTRAPRESLLAPYRLLLRTAGELRAARYDAALVLRFDHWWGAWMAAQAGIPVRVGYGVRECAPFLTDALDPPGRVHWTAQSLRVAARLLEMWKSTSSPGIEASAGDCGDTSVPKMLDMVSAPSPSTDLVEGGEAAGDKPLPYVPGAPPLRFALTPDDDRAAGKLWSEMSLDSRLPVVAFHPGTGSPMKLWPRDRWVALGRALAGRSVGVVITGSPAEVAMAEEIAREIPGGRSLAGRTELGALAALFRRCCLAVGVDSGPLHLAVAVGTPTVHLFGPSDPAVYGPWGDAGRHRVVSGGLACAPCNNLELRVAGGAPAPCMAAITPELVAAECVRVMGDG